MTKDYLRISYSSGGTFDSCARKFEFRKMYPRRTDSTTGLAAEVGKALHAGFQTFLATQSEEKAMWSLLETYPYGLEYVATDDKRSLEACVSTLEKMFDCGDMTDWELLRIKRPDGEIVPAVEVPFELRLNGLDLPDGRGIAIIGFMDAAMRNLTTGLHRTLDIKTHRSTLRDSTPKFKFDNQQTPYGICIGHVTQEPVENFEVLYLDTFVDLLEPRADLYTYRRDSVDIQEWLMNTVLRAQRIIRAVEMDYFPRTDNGCLAFNQPCQYLEMCSLRSREDVMDYMFMGRDPVPEVPTEPWIVADLDVFGDS